MDRATESSNLRELTEDELTAAGGGGLGPFGVGLVLGYALGGPVGAVAGAIIVGYLISPGKAH
jgi:hypothetical protein